MEFKFVNQSGMPVFLTCCCDDYLYMYLNIVGSEGELSEPGAHDSDEEDDDETILPGDDSKPFGVRIASSFVKFTSFLPE